MGRRKREPMSEGKGNIKAVLPQTHYSSTALKIY